jgi:ParB/RepB/Spo0J family partition protein
VGKCRLLKRNPQTLTPRQMTALKRSIQRNGFLAPILVRRAGRVYEIVSGNHRFLAACELGIRLVPCVIADLTDDQVKVLAVNLNLIHGDPTPEQLAPFLGDLAAELLHEIHLEGELLRRTLDFDATLADRLRELQSVPVFDAASPQSSTTPCTCPLCGRQHMRKSMKAKR